MSWNAIAMMAGPDLIAIFVSSGLIKMVVFCYQNCSDLL
jgi:hypothetical protein